MNTIETLVQALQRSEKLLVCGHSMPDGDSIGSTMAMGLLLKAMGKEVLMLSPDPVPKMYGYLPAFGDMLLPEHIPGGIDTAVIVDCTDLNRLGKDLAEQIAKSNTIINIDHHVSNQVYGTANYVDSTASATGEIIFDLIKALGQTLTREIATCLYTAIVMDTGSFRYENTTERTHRISAELVAAGVDVAGINSMLFENKEMTGLLLLGKALSNLKISECGSVAWISIPYELTKELGARDEHAEGIVNYPRRVEGVSVGLLFREIVPGKIKVGFRSKDTVDVNKVAALFGGGGHPKAAGCQLEMPLKEAEEKVISVVVAQVGKQPV